MAVHAVLRFDLHVSRNVILCDLSSRVVVSNLKAIVSESHGQGKVVLKEVRDPGEPGKTEVRLKMKAVGVCGSDIHVYNGTESYPR
ncbi:MAG: alcohol dehydrogenase catalytic domain-containing protein, partial [Thermoplasmata archaeon]|nr:alcohol dehydrogenase catalytic domain-containing protein [Candidatus Sysuiplasma jiujiangense]